MGGRKDGVASPQPNCAGDNSPGFCLRYKMEGAMCRLSLEFVTTTHATQFYPEEMPEHNIYQFYTPATSELGQDGLAAEATACPAFKGLFMFNKQFNKHFLL